MTRTDEFTAQYIDTALWSSTDDEGEPLDENYGVDDIDPETLNRMATDAAAFQEQNVDDIGEWPGADWPEPAATRLTKASEAYGTYDLYVGDDGLIHGYPPD